MLLTKTIQSSHVKAFIAFACPLFMEQELKNSISWFKLLFSKISIWTFSQTAFSAGAVQLLETQSRSCNVLDCYSSWRIFWRFYGIVTIKKYTYCTSELSKLRQIIMCIANKSAFQFIIDYCDSWNLLGLKKNHYSIQLDSSFDLSSALVEELSDNSQFYIYTHKLLRQHRHRAKKVDFAKSYPIWRYFLDLNSIFIQNSCYVWKCCSFFSLFI